MNHNFAFSLRGKNLIVIIQENDNHQESEWLSNCKKYYQLGAVIVFLSPNFDSFEYRIENGPIIKSPHNLLSSLFCFPDFSNTRCLVKIIRAQTAWAAVHHQKYRHFLQDFDKAKALKANEGLAQISNHPDNLPATESYLKIPGIDSMILTDINMLIRFFTLFDTFENLFTSGANLMNCSEFQIDYEYV